MANVRIEVVTPVHNRKDLTLSCLESLGGADLTGVDLHVIVVDDGSTDGTADAIAQEFPEVTVIKADGSLWYTAGTNVGLEAALKNNPDFILAINNDCEFDPDFLQHMLASARAHARSVIGAVLVSWDDRKRVFQVSPKWNVWWGGMRHWVKQTVDTLPEKAWEVELIVGNCVLFPADAIREVGLMDAEHLPQYGDAEYTPRMRKAGWTLFIDPRARVYCKPNDIPERISSMTARRMAATMLFDPYHPHSLRRRLNMIVGSAPNKLEGYAAFVIFFARVFLGRNIEGRWALEQDEQPLSEIYKTTS
ncbi:MAG: glycosyltransferase family 2 protein [Acidobacteriota bacterium]